MGGGGGGGGYRLGERGRRSTDWGEGFVGLCSNYKRKGLTSCVMQSSRSAPEMSITTQRTTATPPFFLSLYLPTLPPPPFFLLSISLLCTPPFFSFSLSPYSAPPPFVSFSLLLSISLLSPPPFFSFSLYLPTSTPFSRVFFFYPSNAPIQCNSFVSIRLLT